MFPCLSTSENNVTELLCFLSSFPVCPGLFSSTIDPRCSIYNPYSTEQQTIQPEEKENEANANTAGMFVKPYLTISCMYTTVHIAFSYICYLKNVGKVGKPEHPQNLPPPPPQSTEKMNHGNSGHKKYHTRFRLVISYISREIFQGSLLLGT